MEIRKTLLAAALAAAATIGHGVASARADIDVYIAPPAPRYEVVPPPRVGYVWVPGYWGWNGHRHDWHRGHWEHERHGYAYVPPRWNRHGDRWRFDDGHWERHR
jgi:hypothetical protein